MHWFALIRQALPAYYPPGSPGDVVGYLRGTVDPAVWRSMEVNSNRQQMLILGSVVPSLQDWAAAGVTQRSQDQTVRLANLNGFIVVYGGFSRRPWGHICILDADALKYFPRSIDSWKTNYTAPKH